MATNPAGPAGLPNIPLPPADGYWNAFHNLTQGPPKIPFSIAVTSTNPDPDVQPFTCTITVGGRIYVSDQHTRKIFAKDQAACRALIGMGVLQPLPQQQTQ